MEWELKKLKWFGAETKMDEIEKTILYWAYIVLLIILGVITMCFLDSDIPFMLSGFCSILGYLHLGMNND